MKLEAFFKTGAYTADYMTMGQKLKAMGIILLITITGLFCVGVTSALLAFFIMGTEAMAASDVSLMNLPGNIVAIGILLSPIYLGLTFHLFLTEYNIWKVRISISLLLASIVYRLFWVALTKWLFNDRMYSFYLNFIIVAIICSLLGFILIRGKCSEKLQIYWQSHFRSIVFGSTVFMTIIFFSSSGGIIMASTRVLQVLMFGFILSFVRVGFGLKYSILLHYSLCVLLLLMSACLYILKHYYSGAA